MLDTARFLAPVIGLLALFGAVMAGAFAAVVLVIEQVGGSAGR